MTLENFQQYLYSRVSSFSMSPQAFLRKGRVTGIKQFEKFYCSGQDSVEEREWAPYDPHTLYKINSIKEVMDVVLVRISVVVIKCSWLKATWGEKGLFYNITSHSHHWVQSEHRNKMEELVQRPWRSAAHRLFPFGLLSLISLLKLFLLFLIYNIIISIPLSLLPLQFLTYNPKGSWEWDSLPQGRPPIGYSIPSGQSLKHKQHNTVLLGCTYGVCFLGTPRTTCVRMALCIVLCFGPCTNHQSWKCTTDLLKSGGDFLNWDSLLSKGLLLVSSWYQTSQNRCKFKI